MPTNNFKPDFLFEVSWEVCNKIGGIHTVIATKNTSIINEYKDQYITIGPEIVRPDNEVQEFEHDKFLYKEWCDQAAQEGLNVKVGRWNLPEKPIAILVDFNPLIIRKDEIFARLWEDYKLDSLSGQWDYIEAALFGYAAGKAIESFVKHNLNPEQKAVAHFHEWMTGCGILHLKKTLPQVATVFTTHATVIGRSLAGNNRPLYDNLQNFNPYDVSRELNLVSKQSLEKLAAQNADTFTTVSNITAQECTKFLDRTPDVITPNGIDSSHIPSEEQFAEKREIARQKLLKVAGTLINEKLPKNTFIIATSGRYEYRNKGIDLFLDTLKLLQESDELDRPLLAFLLIPAHHYGARKELVAALEADEFCKYANNYTTHNLHEPEWDPILNTIEEKGLNKNASNPVKVIFVPSYLNGNDGIFNLPYYDVLIGCDQTIFASYYEPWGYTPLESLLYQIPTVTTTLAGFGVWMQEINKTKEDGVAVIERNDHNDADVIEALKIEVMRNYLFSRENTDKIRKKAFNTSEEVLWSSLVKFYKEAWSLALEKAAGRYNQFVKIEEKQTKKVYTEIRPLSNEPQWKRVIVKSQMPPELEKLNTIVENIWWTWDDDAQALFKYIDPKLWKKVDYNPLILFEQVPSKRLIELSKDKDFVSKVEDVYNRQQAYLAVKPDPNSPKIAYFSMEYGFHDSLKLYSGGLGILAGDYLKEASDNCVDLVALGILYRHGYFTQVITNSGEQQANYEFHHFSKLPVHPLKDENGDFLTIEIVFPGRTLYTRLWYINVGRIKLYLFDTDFDKNLPEDQVISHQLYGGDNENRLKQEMLLGIGGIRVLAEFGIKPNLYHLNEGHSAFCGIERMRRLMHTKQFTLGEAKEIVRSSTLFTTHTPVPAGHDHFDEDLLRRYMGHYPPRLNISWEELMALGRSNPNNWNEKFNMSYLAAHLAQEVNGVSMLHGDVTKDMFSHLWPGYLPEELHVNYVTNGVHWPTWTAPEWKTIYNKMFDNNFVDNQMDTDKWNQIYNFDDKEIWSIKQTLRSKLINYIKADLLSNSDKRHEGPKNIVTINKMLSDKALTIVFARRFATYKRAHLLFRDLNRLSKIVNNKDYPIQFIFAGKAHPADGGGQGLIKTIVEISKRPEFLGKILFVQNYSIELAKYLVSGADIWLNTPTRPLEASGTSGEKAVMNGTMHFSVLDGWWVEGYKKDAGWSLTSERTYDNQEFQDDLDAETIYSILETDIIPSFYKRGEDGIPHDWVSYIKNTISGVAPKFTTRRMITEYKDRFYNKLFSRSQKLFANDYHLIKDLTKWKRKIAHSWCQMEVLDVQLLGRNTETISAGTSYQGQVILRLNDIPSENVGVELVVTEDFRNMVQQKQFEFQSNENNSAVYKLETTIEKGGTFQYGVRVYPKHELLPHRQDFGMLLWV